jgi:hypothetical protein
MDPKEIWLESLEWINVAQDTDSWLVVERAAMKRQGFIIFWKFFDYWSCTGFFILVGNFVCVCVRGVSSATYSAVWRLCQTVYVHRYTTIQLNVCTYLSPHCDDVTVSRQSAWFRERLLFISCEMCQYWYVTPQQGKSHKNISAVPKGIPRISMITIL